MVARESKEVNRAVTRHHRLIEWLLAGFVVVSSVLVWIESRDPSEGAITVYDIFPLFGLLAFGLMWTHFVMDGLRRFYKIDAPKHSPYKTLSFGIVLGLLILHPGLLWLGLYNDGYGLPPASHVAAYENQLLAVGLGTIGLMIFLSYELRRWFSDKRWWKYVQWAQIAGMVAIFIHAIELGGELREDWFALVWWFYGITLMAAIIYVEFDKKRKGHIHGTNIK